jgi:bacteriorhodopsin
MSSHEKSVVSDAAALKPIIPIVPTPPSAEPTKDLNLSHKPNETKEEKKTYYVKFSFMITYILLLTTATLTFIEAMRTNKPHVRHILNLETCISIVAGYFYSVFLSQIDLAEKEKKDMSTLWEDITKTRYVDWSITTPLMLLALCVVLSNNSKTVIHLGTFLFIVALNYLMLGIGFLGEFKVLSPVTASAAGFIPFILMFYTIYITFIAPKANFSNDVLFWVYAVVWGLYGFVYLLEDSAKNITMNILDCVAKCLIGNALYVYYANLIVL